MNTKKILIALSSAFLMGPLMVSAGCGDNAVNPDGAAPRDMSATTSDMAKLPGDMALLPPDMGCYGPANANSSYIAIMNACTPSTSVNAMPSTPLLGDGGALPPLP